MVSCPRHRWYSSISRRIFGQLNVPGAFLIILTANSCPVKTLTQVSTLPLLPSPSSSPGKLYWSVKVVQRLPLGDLFFFLLTNSSPSPTTESLLPSIRLPIFQIELLMTIFMNP